MKEELLKLYDSNEYPFHMPGHKRQNGFGQIATEIDITEIDGYDDLYNADGIIKNALNRASKLYESDNSFFLVNGSTVGILTAIFSATSDRGKILVARNCHKSVYHGIELRKLEADFIFPIEQNGIYGSIDVKEIEKKLEDKKYEAIIITSPTYEGIVSNIASIAELCHKNNTILIVDEAHGAHFGFHERFPKSAISLGADIVIQSTHKTLPTLTQTGLLHVKSDLVDINRIKKYLQMFQTSSPSYVLMSSIDSCLAEIEKKGSIIWNSFFEYRDMFVNRVSNMTHLSLFKSDDECKIVISTAGTNISGPKLQKILLDKYSLQMEMASAEYIVAIVTCNDTEEGFNRFADALLEIDKTLMCSKEDNELMENLDALLNTEAKDYIYIYPPGIPIVVPGELIEKKEVDTIKKYIKAGLTVRGLY